MNWRRDQVLWGGVLGVVGGHLGVDHARIGPASSGFPESVTQISPTAIAELRWPLIATTQTGAVHVLEPVAQVIWGANSTADLPPDLSLMPELDEGNLFAINRFPARDRREGGLRANLGMTWTRYDPAGWTGSVTVGRVYRQRDLDQFSEESPLSGARSDWLVAASLQTDAGLTVSNRSLLSPSFGLSRSALELDWATVDYAVTTTFMRIRADPAENRAETSSEVSFAGSRNITPEWAVDMQWRYDIARSQAARVGAGLTFETDCLRMQMGVERRFASATRSGGSTSFGLNIDILGVGGAPGRGQRACSSY